MEPLHMTLMIALPVMLFGVRLARRILGTRAEHAQPTFLLAVLSGALLLCGVESRLVPKPPLHRLDTNLEVATPPALVWRHLDSFPDLPAYSPGRRVERASATQRVRFVNRSGQDIEYRLAGGGIVRAPEATWTVLKEGREVVIDERSMPGTLEVRVAGRTMLEVLLDAFGELVEVGRNLRIKILRRFETTPHFFEPA